MYVKILNYYAVYLKWYNTVNQLNPLKINQDSLIISLYRIHTFTFAFLLCFNLLCSALKSLTHYLTWLSTVYWPFLGVGTHCSVHCYSLSNLEWFLTSTDHSINICKPIKINRYEYSTLVLQPFTSTLLIVSLK